MVVGIASIGGIGRVIGGMVVEGRGVVGGLRRIRQNSVEYRRCKVAVPRKIFRLVRNEELCGVIVYSYPPPACYGRRLVLSRMTIQEMNKQLSIINRVVIHPKYRTVGLGAKMIRETRL